MASSTSIRINQTLYDQARSEAIAEHRTIAGQIEYWAKVGRAYKKLHDNVAADVDAAAAQIAENPALGDRKKVIWQTCAFINSEVKTSSTCLATPLMRTFA